MYFSTTVLPQTYRKSLSSLHEMLALQLGFLLIGKDWFLRMQYSPLFICSLHHDAPSDRFFKGRSGLDAEPRMIGKLLVMDDGGVKHI